MKNILQCCCLAIALLVVLPAQAQLLARIHVKAGAHQRTNVPLSISLSNHAIVAADFLQLLEVQGNKRRPVPFQIGDDNKLYWILEGTTTPGKIRTFELLQSSAHNTPVPVMLAQDTAGMLILKESGHHLLCYNYRMVYPPAGVDSCYRRSGFIHPLWAPDGQVLTNMHPVDHWHHVGIWNPWTHTMFKGKETDFWNLQKKEGTVRFNGFLSRNQGPVLCGFHALQDHIAFRDGKEVIAMNEECIVQAYNSGTDSNRRIWDFTSILNGGDTAGITFLQYRYGGGFALRATAAWTAANSQVLTSEGKNRINADSTRARWIKITGNTSVGQAGLLIMCHPANYDYPQPLRVWPENAEKGEIMMNYSPTKMKPWQLLYGRSYVLQYRVMVFNKDLTPQEAEDVWQNYAQPAVIDVSWR
jgi:hypothetical protein